MLVKPLSPRLATLLLLAATPWAAAQSPLPDPVAPAVIGRPLDQIGPVRPARTKPAAARAERPKAVAAAPQRSAVPVAPTTAAAAAQAVQATQAPPAQRAPTHAADDRARPGAAVPNDVGRGTHLASKPLGPGAYFSSRYQALVRKYYETNPVRGQAAGWKIGEPVPPGAKLTGVPDDLRGALPPLPPGHQYVQLDGEVILVAVQSRMVIDGVSRNLR